MTGALRDNPTTRSSKYIMFFIKSATDGIVDLLSANLEPFKEIIVR